MIVWLNQSHRQEWAHYRAPATDNDVCSIEEIALEVLKAEARTVSAEDQALEVARLFVIRRLNSTARSKIEEAIKAKRSLAESASRQLKSEAIWLFSRYAGLWPTVASLSDS